MKLNRVSISLQYAEFSSFWLQMMLVIFPLVFINNVILLSLFQNKSECLSSTWLAHFWFLSRVSILRVCSDQLPAKCWEKESRRLLLWCPYQPLYLQYLGRIYEHKNIDVNQDVEKLWILRSCLSQNYCDKHERIPYCHCENVSI